MAKGFSKRPRASRRGNIKTKDGRERQLHATKGWRSYRAGS